MSQTINPFHPLKIRQLGRQDYKECWSAMQCFTQKRDKDTEDEIWIVEHNPVYTLGLNGKEIHVLDSREIPVVKCDRGGQITYHGPGQLVVYFLLDIESRKWGVKKLVNEVETLVIDLLSHFGIRGHRKDNAPGVYVATKKIAALGFRVKKGYTYHGLSLNVDMDLSPFDGINPCGYEGMESTQMIQYNPNTTFTEVSKQLRKQIASKFASINSCD